MTTVELQAQHWQEQYNNAAAEVSRLEGEAHALELVKTQLEDDITELLKDNEYLRGIGNERNLIIAGLEQLLLSDVEQG